MPGSLSSVMSIAGAGLLPNPPADIGTAITANTDLGNSITVYTGQEPVAKFIAVVTLANTKIGPADNQITSSTYDTLFTISATSFPAITDVPSTGNVTANLVPYGLTSNLRLVTDIVDFNSDQILGNGDVSKFCQVFSAAQGYISQANATLKSVRNSQQLAPTFDPKTGGMDTLSTGSLNQVTTDFASTSSDFALLGELINLANLDDLGLPGELLAQLGRQAGGEVPAVSDLLLAVNIPQDKVRQLGRGNNTLNATEERSAYTALMAVTGSVLQQVSLLLRVRVPGIINMAQLLNPRAILPNCWDNLLCPSTGGLEPIYLPNGSINSNLRLTVANPDVTAYTGVNNTNSLEILEKIIPPDQALANKALARSLSQIKNVINATLPGISAAMAAVQGNQDLGAIANLTTPVPASVQSFYQQQLGNGTGANGTILLGDVIATPSGIGVTSEFTVVSNALSNISSSTTTLTSCFDNMLNTLGNVYGDNPTVIPSGPGAGSYTNFNDAFVTGLIPAANSLVATISSVQSTEVGLANQAWGNIVAGLARQRTNQQLAQINFSELANVNQSAAMAFTTNLHDYGLDVEPGGANQYLVAVANTASLSGQSVIASLREGRNIESLQQAGIALDTQLADR